MAVSQVLNNLDTHYHIIIRKLLFSITPELFFKPDASIVRHFASKIKVRTF